MPPALVKTASVKLHMPYPSVVQMWKQAIKITKQKKKTDKGDLSWKYVVGVLKRILGKQAVKKLGWKVTGSILIPIFNWPIVADSQVKYSVINIDILSEK